MHCPHYCPNRAFYLRHELTTPQTSARSIPQPSIAADISPSVSSAVSFSVRRRCDVFLPVSCRNCQLLHSRSMALQSRFISLADGWRVNSSTQIRKTECGLSSVRCSPASCRSCLLSFEEEGFVRFRSALIRNVWNLLHTSWWNAPSFVI